jgi:hypothetical protein
VNLFFNCNLFILGGENICRLLDYVEDKKDLWLIYEVCKGQTMNEAMFEVKGKFINNKSHFIL